MDNSSTDNLANVCDISTAAACCAQFLMDDDGDSQVPGISSSSILFSPPKNILEDLSSSSYSDVSLLRIGDYLSVWDLIKAVLRRLLPTTIRRALVSLLECTHESSDEIKNGIFLFAIIFMTVFFMTYKELILQKMIVYGVGLYTFLNNPIPAKNLIGASVLSQNNEADENENIEKSNFEYTNREEHRDAIEQETPESGVDIGMIPKHVAVIMDGNRRYGKEKFGNTTEGHWQGSRKVVDFAQWCIIEGVQTLTLYAFSTENWRRDPSEISALMTIFCKYCDEIRIEALQKGIRVKVLSTHIDKIPENVSLGIKRLEAETSDCSKFLLNICLSYGSRGEIVNACKSIAAEVQSGRLTVDDINEHTISSSLLTHHCEDPDVVIRTSGECRLSNFLLWQLAYSELFFVNKRWPAIEKEDLLSVIRTYALCRRRRYGC